jgi:hypothetical protein
MPLALVLLLSFRLGQQLQPSQPAHHTIAGTVVNAITGEPIARALVQVWGSGSLAGLTDADGRFQISNVPEGTLSCNVTKPGFFSPAMIPGRQQEMCKVGPDSGEVRLTLFPAAKITGRFTDENGDSIPDMPIQVMAQSIMNGRKNWGMRASATSDEDGAYRTDDLTPGRYILFVPGHVSSGAPQDDSEVFGPAYYPDASDLVSAQAIEVQPGEEYRADFHLRPRRGYRISGTLQNYAENMGASVGLRDSSGQSTWWPVMFDPKRGTFVIRGVPPGAWTISVMANDQGHQYEATQEVAVEQADLTNVKVTLHLGVTIPLTITRSGDTGTQYVNATLISMDGVQERQYGSMLRDQKSSPFFENVMPGKYRLQVQSFPNQCVESAWYGSVDLRRDYLIVGPDGGAQPMIINLTSDCARLSANIAADEQRSYGMLLLVPGSGNQDPITWPVGRTTPTAPNAFRNNSIALSPGTYQVYAFTDVNQLEYANPDVLKQYPSQTVELSAGQKIDLSVTLSDPKAR